MKVQTNFRGVFCGFGAQITVLGRLEVRTTRHHNLAEHQPPPPPSKTQLGRHRDQSGVWLSVEEKE